MTPSDFLAMRRALGLSQQALGRQLGKHRNTIAAYESGAQAIPSAIAQLVPFLLTAHRKEPS